MGHFHSWLDTATPFGPMTPLAALVVGAVLLFFGRRLFWLFVAVVGFLAGWHFAATAWHGVTPGGRLLLALVAGVVGLILALLVQKIAVAIAGFLVGTSMLATLLGWPLATMRPGQQLVLLVAGILAAVLALVLFDYALIFFSAVAGANLVLEAIPLRAGGNVHLLLLIILAVFGAAVQARWLDSARPRRA